MRPMPHWEWTLANLRLGDFDFDIETWPAASAVSLAVAQSMQHYAKQKKEILYDKSIYEAFEATAAQAAWFSLFKRHGAHVFKLAREFGEALFDAPVNVRADYIVFDNLMRCIEFPESIRIDMGGGFHARCAYVVATDYMKFDQGVRPVLGEKALKGIPLDDNGNFKRPLRSIHIIVPLYDDGETVTDTMDTCGVNFFTEDEDIHSAIERARLNSDTPGGLKIDVLSYTLKSLLYIHSGDPDLREFRPTRCPQSPKKQRRWFKQNIAKIPMTLVGFDFKKPKVFSKDETRVRFHSRWQPYGPQRSKVKLIWIDEHVRRLNKQIIETDEK